jgi:AraC-like DNA-binding protein
MHHSPFLTEAFNRHEPVKQRIQRILAAMSDAMPSLEQMASRFSMSSHTLKRRLQGEQACYSDLVEAELRQRAERLLVDERLPVAEVASQLGYHDVSNFSRAFRRWTGLTPREYRDQAVT